MAASISPQQSQRNRALFEVVPERCEVELLEVLAVELGPLLVELGLHALAQFPPLPQLPTPLKDHRPR